MTSHLCLSHDFPRLSLCPCPPQLWPASRHASVCPFHLTNTRVCLPSHIGPVWEKFVSGVSFGGIDRLRERVLFIGTQFSILYTSMYSKKFGCTRSRQPISDKMRLLFLPHFNFRISLFSFALVSTGVARPPEMSCGVSTRVSGVSEVSTRISGISLKMDKERIV